MAEYQKEDFVGSMVFRIALALIGSILVVVLLAPILPILTLWGCSGCNALTNAFVTVIIPISVAFIGIYKIIKIFTE